MKKSTEKFLTELIKKYPSLVACEKDIKKAYDILYDCYSNSGKVLVCGNGGSAADSEHIVGELMKGFHLPRKLTAEDEKAFSDLPDGLKIADGLQKGLPAISLVSHTGLMTAFLNDCDPELLFAQQVYVYMKNQDVLIALSTSGNSKNVVNACITAKALKGKTIAITGENESKLSGASDVTIKLPSEDTAEIQEYTLPVYHCLCAMLEEEFFGE